MANCASISGPFAGVGFCKNNLAGIKALWVADYDDEDVVEVAAGEVSAVKLAGSDPAATVWAAATSYTAGDYVQETVSDPVYEVKADYTSGASIAIDIAAGDLSLFGAREFYKFPLPIDLGDAVEDTTVDTKFGSAFVTQTINGTLLGLSKEASLQLSTMFRGKQRILAELYDGEFILYGAENGLDITGGGSRTGAEAASLQGYEMTFTGKEKDYAPFAASVTIVGTTATLA